MKRLLFVIALTAAFGFIFASCGDGTSDTNTNTDTGSSSGTPGSTVTFDVPGAGSGKVYIYIPSSYSPGTQSPVIFLFNEQINDWKIMADADAILIVDLDEYNDTNAYITKLNAVTTELEANYDVDNTRYYWAGWSAGGNIVIQMASQNQAFLAATMVFPGTGGQPAYNNLNGYGGHKIRLYYACGTEDTNYPWANVQNEADTFAGIGYITRFDKVDGAGHAISEGIYHKRQDAWDWVKGFTNQN